MTVAERIRNADEYLQARTGRYELRCERYDAALEALHGLGLADHHTVMDVGSGWGEFGVRLHTGVPWHNDVSRTAGCSVPPSRARYIPIDAAIDGTDLEDWTPPRDVDFIVALEVVEHVSSPSRLINRMMLAARRGVVISTPNPATTDVLGMDPTHKTPVGPRRLKAHGFSVEEASFYGEPADSLFAVWRWDK